MAAGCGIFLVEESDSGCSKYLQAFELEDSSGFEPQINEFFKTLNTIPAYQGIGENTFQRYLSRLEVLSAANMNNYQFLQMESDSGDKFRAKRVSFLSIFPGQNTNIQVDSIVGLCPSIDGLEAATTILE